jgi:hypothetical protein
VQRLGSRGRPAAFDQVVDPLELNEGDRDGPVLGCSATLEDVRPNRRRQASRKHFERHRRTGMQRDFGDAASWLALEKHPGTLRSPETTGREQRGRFGTE